MAVEYGQPYWHPTKRCNNCQGRIAVRARWDNSSWGGTETPMSDEKWCENRCPSHLTGASGW